MNIVLIVIDTLRYDHVGANGNGRISTPALDRLASRSWVFDRAFSASYPTIPHRIDVMTGRPGSPFHAWGPLRFDVSTLPQTLASHGYCTQLIHDTPHMVNGGHNFDWPFHAWTPVRGAEVDRPWIDDRPETPLDNWTRDGLFDFIDKGILNNAADRAYRFANRKRKKDGDWNCAKLFLTAAEWLKDNRTRDKFFLWIDCFDPHEPWDAPPRYVKLYDKTPGADGRIDPRSFYVHHTDGVPEAALRRVRAQYAAKVSWMDHWLGRFLDTLDKTGLADRTAVILTSDHGTSLGETGYFHKGYPVREQEGHVPFFVSVPGGGTGRSSRIVQPQDIFATVAAIAGVGMPEGLDSYDVLSRPRRAGGRPRELAISGTCMKGWRNDGDAPLFGAFDGKWCIEVALKRSNCKLRRMGAAEDVAARHKQVVGRLHAAAIAEMARRGAHPALVAWLKSGKPENFPEDCPYCDGWPLPSGFRQYFYNLF